MNMPVLAKSQIDCIWPPALDRWLLDQDKSYDDLAADIAVDKSRVRRWKQAGHIPWGQVRLLAMFTGLSSDLFFSSGSNSPVQTVLSGLVDLTRRTLIFDDIPEPPVYSDISDTMSYETPRPAALPESAAYATSLIINAADEPAQLDPVMVEPAEAEQVPHEPVAVEAEPTVAEPEPAVEPAESEPVPHEPMVVEPEPAVAEPEPSVVEEAEQVPHEPVAVEAEPTVAEPEPAVEPAEPEPVPHEPTVVEPEPAVEPAESEPVPHEPTVVEPEPAVAEPEPAVEPAEPEPVPHEPMVVEPEPAVAEPEPAVAEPEPSVVEPTAVSDSIAPVTAAPLDQTEAKPSYIVEIRRRGRPKRTTEPTQGLAQDLAENRAQEPNTLSKSRPSRAEKAKLEPVPVSQVESEHPAEIAFGDVQSEFSETVIDDQTISVESRDTLRLPAKPVAEEGKVVPLRPQLQPQYRPLSLATAPARTCQYPVAETSEGKVLRFCEKPSIDGKSYCQPHASICFITITRHSRAG